MKSFFLRELEKVKGLPLAVRVTGLGLVIVIIVAGAGTAYHLAGKHNPAPSAAAPAATTTGLSGGSADETSAKAGDSTPSKPAGSKQSTSSTASKSASSGSPGNNPSSSPSSPNLTLSLGRYPLAGGDSSGNQKLNGAGQIVAMRLVARHTGTLFRIDFKTRTTGGSSYESGSLGTFSMELRKVLATGLPDMSAGGLMAGETISAGDPSRSLSAGAGDQAWLNTNVAVTQGDEFVLLVKNTDPSPTVNYASVNFLYFGSHSPPGAQSRNERDPAASDAYLGLDPREIVGASRDGGSSWSFPGTTDPAYTQANNIPVYIQEYSDGFKDGQPYYSASASSGGSYTNSFQNNTKAWHITDIAGYVSDNGGSSPVSLAVNGAVKSTVTLSGPAHSIARATLPTPVDAPAGSTVSLTFTIDNTGGAGLDVRPLYTDSYHWTGYLGLGSSYIWYTSASAAGAPSHYIAPVYPLPFWKTVGVD